MSYQFQGDYEGPMYGEGWRKMIANNVIALMESRKDDEAIDGSSSVVVLDGILARIESRAADEFVEPTGTDRPSLPIPVIVTLTDEQKDTAYQVWDDTMPGLFPERDVKGLLDATPYDPDDEEEERE